MKVIIVGGSAGGASCAARLRRLVEQVNPGCDLEVDGGIDATTAPLAVDAGANVLVAGSAIFNDDREEVARAIKRLRDSIRQVMYPARAVTQHHY